MTPNIKNFSKEEARNLGHDIGDFDEFPVKRMSARGCKIDYEEGEGCLWVLNIATRPEYRQQGRATRLLKHFLAHAAKLNKSINWGSFSPQGELYLKPVIERLTGEKL